MATRTLGLSVETYLCNNYEDDYVEVSVTSNNYAFGNDVPTYISFNFPTTSLRADYANGVTFEWEIILHFNNGVSVTVYEGTVYSCTSSTNLSVYDIALPSQAVSAFQQSTIDYIELYPTRENRRLLRGRGGSATCTITYTETVLPTLSTPGAPTLSQNGNMMTISWSPAYGYYGSGYVTYYILVNGDEEMWYVGTSTSFECEIPSNYYGVSKSYSIRADYSGLMAWGNSTSFTPKSIEVHRTIRCYLNGAWQDCIVKYYDGANWIECVAKYFDGSQWQDCSF